MRLYIATKWEEREKARRLMDFLETQGHTITYDWTKDASNFNAPQAVADRQGVLDAEAFIGIFEKDLHYNGALVEMGIAVARGIPIYILGNAIDNNIFTLLPEVKRGIGDLLNERVSVRSN